MSLLILMSTLMAASTPSPHEAASRDARSIPFSSDAWSISADEHRIETIDGVETLWLHNGRAVLPGAGFVNGVLEVDVSLPDARGFSGVLWHLDGDDYENFYLRSHLSGKPDASQYQPVFHGVAGWQIYSGSAYCAPVELRAHDWMHLRVEVSGRRAQIFLDSETPVLVIDGLGREGGDGALGISSGFAAARFANFTFQATDDVTVPPAPEVSPLEEHRIATWSVSSAFPERRLADRDHLDLELLDQRTWSLLDVEPNGIANLARVQPLSAGNTTLARLVLEADAPTRQRVDFGFSDRVRVYHDGELVFAADDGYLSRDYRYLGTVGLHDAVYLDLSEGTNVVDFAVSEDFGGWGITARVEPRDGVRWKQP